MEWWRWRAATSGVGRSSGGWTRSSKSVRLLDGVLDQLPRPSHVPLLRRQVSDGEPDGEMTGELRVRQERLTAGVHAFHYALVQSVDRRRVAAQCRRVRAKAHDAERLWRQPLKLRVGV